MRIGTKKDIVYLSKTISAAATIAFTLIIFAPDLFFIAIKLI